MCHVIAHLQNSDVLSVCGRSCISYGLIQIVRDVTSCSFFSIFVSSFSCARDVEISVVPDFDP